MNNPVDQILDGLGLKFSNPVDEERFRSQSAALALPRQRVLLVFTLIVYLVYAVRDIALGPTFGYGPLYLRVFFILPAVATVLALSYLQTLQPRFHAVMATIVLIMITAQGALSLLYPHFGPTDPTQANRTMSSMMLILAVTTVAGLRFAYATGLGLLAVMFWFVGSFAKELAPSLYPTLLLNIVTTFVVGVFAAFWIEHAQRTAFAANNNAAHEKAKSDAALFAQIPRHIVGRIAENDRPIAEPFVEAVVVLADLAGFNTLARRIGPKETVRVLDHVFSAFDELGERCRMERVRTVGDSYMAVGGAYEGAHGDAADAARMAQEMVAIVADAAKRFDLPLAVRVGVHVGPLIGGVVGQSSPIYDFWGDTLNVVNELEASGAAGKIHCSEPFYWRLGDTWRFEEQGSREFRGVGTLTTYYLVGPIETATAAPEGA